MKASTGGKCLAGASIAWIPLVSVPINTMLAAVRLRASR